MDISVVYIGTGVIAFTSMLLAIAISIVSQMFYVKIDPRIEEIYNILPHFNCGACGYPGCQPYAESIINDNELRSKCRPGRTKVYEQILDILNEKKV